MIELDIVLDILRELNGEAIDKIESPGDGRDAFAFGQVNGIIWTVREMRQRLEAKIRAKNQDEG
jgi:hypothetical protein